MSAFEQKVPARGLRLLQTKRKSGPPRRAVSVILATGAGGHTEVCGRTTTLQGIDHRFCRNKRGGSPREHKTRLQNKVSTPVPFVEAHGRLGQLPVLFPRLDVSMT